MFKKLAFSYEAFVLLTGAAFVSKALSLPLWGAIASRKGGRFLLGLGGVGVIPLSSLWTYPTIRLACICPNCQWSDMGGL